MKPKPKTAQPTESRPECVVDRVAAIIELARRGDITPHEAAERVLAPLGQPMQAPLPPPPTQQDGGSSSGAAACGTTPLRPPAEPSGAEVGAEVPDPQGLRDAFAFWDAQEAALAARDAQVAAGFPDQENPEYHEEPGFRETAKRFSYLSACGVAKAAIGKIEKRVLSPAGALEVESLVVIAREAIAALHRVWQAERDGWLGPVALLREEFSTKPFPTLHFPDSRSEEARLHANFLRDLDDGDFSKSAKRNNKIESLVRSVVMPALSKLTPMDMSHEDWAKVVIVLLKKIAASSPRDPRRKLVLHALNAKRIPKKQRDKKWRRAYEKMEDDLKKVGTPDTAFASATPEEVKQERKIIVERFEKRWGRQKVPKPNTAQKNEAWSYLETEICKWARKYRRNGFSVLSPPNKINGGDVRG